MALSTNYQGGAAARRRARRQRRALPRKARPAHAGPRPLTPQINSVRSSRCWAAGSRLPGAPLSRSPATASRPPCGRRMRSASPSPDTAPARTGSAPIRKKGRHRSLLRDSAHGFGMMAKVTTRPPAPVLAAFGISTALLQPLPGGQRMAWSAGELVLKLLDMSLDTLVWQEAVLSDITEDGFRLARPVRTRNWRARRRWLDRMATPGRAAPSRPVG